VLFHSFGTIGSFKERTISILFEITFLGTSASAPSAKRSLPAQVVMHDEFRFLIDCGEGTQRQILLSGIGFKRLNRILITHGHLDHILGLAGLVSTMLRWEAMDDLQILGGQKTLDRIHDLIYGVVLRGAGSNQFPIQLRTVEPGVFFESDAFTISAFPVFHRGTDSLGYAFQEKGKRPFLPEKAEQLNLPPGPWRRELVEGRSITLPDGRVITPDMVLGDYKSGARLVYVGDTGETESLLEVCRDADMLVIEATYLDAEAEMAASFSHLTARQAAELALKAGVKQLILTHISRRYRTQDVKREARAVFPNTEVARDLDKYQIRFYD